MMRKLFPFLLFILCILIFSGLVFSAEVKPEKIYVVDGDTFHMNGQKIQIWGGDLLCYYS